jgi:3-oxoacyl-[acyl-carrier protein] reductase
MPRLANKVCAVTGAGTGIGRAIALGFAAEGAKLSVSDRDESAARATADAIRSAGGHALACACDVSR